MNLQPETIHYKTAVIDKSTTVTTLIERVKKGDMAAFESIMRRYNQRLYRIARSILKDEHEAMDVVQETYIKAYYQLHQFNGPDGFASWLSRIASNEAMMQLRKSKRIQYILDNDEHEHIDMESSEPQPLDKLATRQLRKLLEEAIDTLAVDLRSVYVLRAIQQLSTREVAESLGVSEDVVKTRYLRAKRKLKQIFVSHVEEAGQTLYEFAGSRCDYIVQAVKKRLKERT